jgi:hypothetical protein
MIGSLPTVHVRPSADVASPIRGVPFSTGNQTMTSTYEPSRVRAAAAGIA